MSKSDSTSQKALSSADRVYGAVREALIAWRLAPGELEDIARVELAAEEAAVLLRQPA